MNVSLLCLYQARDDYGSLRWRWGVDRRALWWDKQRRRYFSRLWQLEAQRPDRVNLQIINLDVPSL